MSSERRSALLVMDMQRNVVDRLPSAADLPGRLATAVSAARGAGVQVIYVVAGFRAGYPEIGDRSGVFTGVRDAGILSPGDPGAEIHGDLVVEPGDVIVTKKRVSAFVGSDLEIITRARGITDLVLTGMVTSGVVLSTLRQAADLDYGLTVLSDGCVDYDDEVQHALMTKVFPRQSAVLTIDEWARKLD
ncbi:cysteine hydrolase family protein [Amycolatopsis thermoflava]|uniref:Nicotinamidase-related amidase n=1 Tax=Amycolatopsis thermoflava TaxID=84480 RepID=A0A3N2GP98_9PSEU|nr:cysteine hydrolase [Amycolatopsis thermoflava]ROS38448.1 nicotinamidase-related amidase [Amycolatopsis thermoflava]